MPKYFPLFINSEKHRTVIVGNAGIDRKVNILRPFGFEIYVFSEKRRSLKAPNKDIRVRRYDWMDFMVHLNPYHRTVIVVADASETLIRDAVRMADDLHIPISVEDRPDISTFIFPAIERKGDLTVAVSTNGRSPTLAKKMRDVIAKKTPDCVDGIIELLNEMRSNIKRDFPGITRREYSKILRKICDFAFRVKRLPTECEIAEIIKVNKPKGTEYHE